MLELDRPESVADPLVEALERRRRLGQMKVGLSSRQILPQLSGHLRQASATRAASDLPDAVFEGFQCLGGHRDLDRISSPSPEAERNGWPDPPTS